MEHIKTVADIAKTVNPKELSVEISASICEIMRMRKYRASHMAKKFGVSNSSISTVRNKWKNENFSISNNNTTIVKIVCYYLDNRHDIEDLIVTSLGSIQNVRKIETWVNSKDTSVDYPKMVTMAYITAYDMLRIDVDFYEKKYKNSFLDHFILFRNASISGMVVSSAVQIRQRVATAKVWEYFHTKADGLGRISRSDGIVAPMHQNFYMISDIENGKGIENITINIPVMGGSDLIDGFISTLDGFGVPFISKCCLIPARLLRENSPPKISSEIGDFLKTDVRYEPGERVIGTWKPEELEWSFPSHYDTIMKICSAEGVISFQKIGEIG